MLLISIRSIIFTEFPKSINNIDVDSLNSNFEQLKQILEFFENKLIEKGYEMPSLFFKKANSIEDIVDTYNFNISQIDSFLSYIETLVPLFNFSWEELNAVNVSFKNLSYQGKIEIDNNTLNILIKNDDNLNKTIKIDNNGVVTSENN